MKRATRLLTGCLLLVITQAIALQTLGGVARATNWSGASGLTTTCPGPLPGVNMADNANHYFWYDGVGTEMVVGTNTMRTGQFDPTDVNTFLASSLTSTTDVVVKDDNYTNYCGWPWDGAVNIFGATTCKSLSGARCQQHEIRYDTSDTSGLSSVGRQALACHEVGHSLGLLHLNETACMYPFFPTNIYNYLSSHDRSHLNANY